MSISTISYSEDIELDQVGAPPISRTNQNSDYRDKERKRIQKKIRMASRGRVCCLGLSSTLAIFSLILLTVCMFSASFRYNSDSLGGVKNYGLFRFCYTPESQSQSRDDYCCYYCGPVTSHLMGLATKMVFGLLDKILTLFLMKTDDSNSKTCHLRNYINSAYCQDRANSNHEKSTRNCFGDFELATIILISTSMACCLLALCFSICTIFTSFGALAHSVVLIAAAICSLSGFLAYTYYYELKDNQYELVIGYQYQIHYGWAYYVFGFSSLIQWAAFVCSLFGSAFVLVHKNKKRQSKVTSTSL